MMDKRKEALEFLSSPRGQYIIGQALYKAIEVMEKEPVMKREVSNISDMKFLMENLFPMFSIIEKVKMEG